VNLPIENQVYALWARALRGLANEQWLAGELAKSNLTCLCNQTDLAYACFLDSDGLCLRGWRLGDTLSGVRSGILFSITNTPRARLYQGYRDIDRVIRANQILSSLSSFYWIREWTSYDHGTIPQG
jgi:hypothetical protein